MSEHLSRREFINLGIVSAFSLAFKDHIAPSTTDAIRYGSADASGMSERLLSETNFPPEKFLKREGKLILDGSPQTPIDILLFPTLATALPDFYNETTKAAAEVEEIQITIPVVAKDLYFPGDKLPHEVVTTLPYIMAGRNLVLAKLDKKSYWDTAPSRDAVGKNWIEGHTLLSPFYPNKNRNILVALKSLDDYQMRQGGIPGDTETSLLDILNFEHEGSKYYKGSTSSRLIVRGGGVCAFATLVARVNMGSGETETLERWAHPTEQMYESSLFAGEKYAKRTTDATVELSSDGEKYDYKWRFKGNVPYYYHIHTQMVYLGGHVEDLEVGKSDSCLVVTIGLSHEKPDPNQGERLAAELERYNETRNETKLPNSQIKLEEWRRNSRLHKLLDGVEPIEGIYPFESDLQRSEFLQSISNLRAQINAYIDQREDHENVGVGSYLKRTEWYKTEASRLGEETKARNQLESALRVLDQLTDRVAGQPVQCVTFVSLLSSMNHVVRFFNVGGLPVRSAKQMIPKEIYSRSISSHYVKDGSYTVFRVDEPGEIDSVNPGDLFLGDLGKDGHVGAVIGKKKDEEGNVVLLCADANAMNDGRVRIFTVHHDNWDFKFGPYPRPSLFIKGP